MSIIYEESESSASDRKVVREEFRGIDVRTQILLICFTLAFVAAYHGPDLPPGPYCGQRGSRNGCCQNRRDSCSHRILDTLCYCDEFCNRTRALDDCCPDYEEVCLGLRPPENIEIPVCWPGQKKTDKCNRCECTEINGKPAWSCDRDACLISDDVIHAVNGGRSTWRAANYTEFAGRKLKDGLIYRLGTLPLSMETKRMNAIHYDKDIPYPRDFDARTRWPNYISPVVDQGWCGSDWAVSIAGVASDRFAIQSNGAERMVLSPQSLLSCNLRGQQACDGGHIDIAWNFAGQYGLVDEDCLPYRAEKGRCPYRLKGNLVEAGCTPMIRARTSKYKVGPPYRVKTERDVMFDIMESGPVQAVMTVYQDFFHYRDGIYRRTPYGDQKLQGLHGVRIIGWGEDRGEKFWIAANSWGTSWGENGYFRIARGSNESGIESFIVTAFSDVTEANMRK